MSDLHIFAAAMFGSRPQPVQALNGNFQVPVPMVSGNRQFFTAVER